MKHVSNLEIQGFIQRDLQPAALLEFDDHLSECAECQAALEQACVAYSDSQFAAAFAGTEPHLTYEELRAFAANDPIASAVTAHAARCKDCAREAAELRAFADELDRTPRAILEDMAATDPKGRRYRINPAWFALAATILVIAIAGVYWRYSPRQEIGANVVASLRDGDAQLTLNSSGQLQGAKALSAEQQDLLKAALMSGRLPSGLPPEFAGQKTETMLGAPEAAASFNVLSPVNRVSMDDRPTFQWEVLAGATAYRVAIYGTDYQKVAESPVLHQTKWQAPVALPRGSLYTWTVTANGPNGAIHSPAPPQPEAMFKVISADQAAALAQAAQEHAGDPLLMAALYARAGAVDEAQAQIDKLAGQNPNSVLVAQLKASLAASSRAQAPSPIKTNAAQ
jgi:hypothetical protein